MTTESEENPDPKLLADIRSSDGVEDARAAAARFGGRDEERWKRPREAFSSE
ncbi:hypothetical protein HYG81_11765 [Natrinema zhouii]|uniref:Uncharacterized protein n=1 Tax=Natrinema zhouii TaxID=1710539 RepID=A0A7D6H3U1_9EURY|nr:hypothetical protein [Natrinema zhouii]QLK24788.1 hypothetical protein HYG81_11765 [Natrinema zhouii]